MNLSSSIINFDECLTKINNYYNISAPLIFIIDRIGNYNNPSTKYAFFNPLTGEKLIISFCDNTSILIKRKISYLNKSDYKILYEQNVVFLNLNSSFYTNNCFQFKTFNKKDMTLKDRILH